ncbi:hypothetical protein EON67_02295 [archaeon]|nr:MAG: hypothetical protein EON67_02295 [archaeon]
MGRPGVGRTVPLPTVLYSLPAVALYSRAAFHENARARTRAAAWPPPFARRVRAAAAGGPCRSRRTSDDTCARLVVAVVHWSCGMGVRQILNVALVWIVSHIFLWPLALAGGLYYLASVTGTVGKVLILIACLAYIPTYFGKGQHTGSRLWYPMIPWWLPTHDYFPVRASRAARACARPPARRPTLRAQRGGGSVTPWVQVSALLATCCGAGEHAHVGWHEVLLGAERGACPRV